jgi:uncharacterized membrane protein (UPF0127 family)
VHRLPRAAFVAVALFVSALAGPASAQTHAQTLRTEPLEIVTAGGVRHFTVEVADTDATRETGLMFRKSMAPNRGMLFDFGTPQTVTFWMKNTLIPLDMIFIAQDGHVVSITRNAVPMSEAIIPSGGPIVGVLELRGGRAAEIGVKPGDVVRDRIFQR